MERAIWALIAVTGALAAAVMSHRGLALDWASVVLPVTTVAVLEGLALFYRRWRPDERLAGTIGAMAQLVALTALDEILSYAVASVGEPLWDDTLLRWDRALGFDWPAFLRCRDTHTGLDLVLTVAYQSLMPQLAVVVIALGFTRRIDALRRCVFAFGLAALIAVTISGLMPAMAMYVATGLKPTDFPHINPAAAYVHVAALEGLRDGTLRVVSLLNAEGIITFPSFHAALAVIFTVAFWPLRLLRWPAVVLNVLLIVATPVDGGHYLVDLIGGCGVALLAVGGARLVDRAQGLRTPPTIGRGGGVMSQVEGLAA